MYLREAKKRAEKEHKQRKAKERAEARQAARDHARQAATGAAPRARAQSTAAAEAEAALRKAQVAERTERTRAVAEEQLRLAMEQSVLDEERRKERVAAGSAVDAEYIVHRSRAQQAQARTAAPPRPVLKSAPLVDKPLVAMAPPNSQWTDAQVGCRYVGTFPVGPAQHPDRDVVKKGVGVMAGYLSSARPAVLVICLEGIKVIDSSSQRVAMAHALQRISMCSVDPSNHFLYFVAKNPGHPDKFCHVFSMRDQRNADETRALVGKAFKLAFATKTLKRQKKRQGAPPPRASPTPRVSPTPAPPPGHAYAQPPPSYEDALRDPPAPTPAPAPVLQMPQTRRQWARHNPLEGAPHRSANPQAARPSRAQQQAPAPAAVAPVPIPEKVMPLPSARAARAEEEVDSLDNAAWYQAGIPREVAIELLEKSEEGSFIVRDSQSQPGNFALTIKCNSRMHHFIITQDTKGYAIKTDSGEGRYFPDLAALIIFHSQNKGALPGCLSLDSFNTLFEEPDSDDDEDEDELDAQSFIDPAYQELHAIPL